MERRKKIRNEIRRGRRKDDVRDVDIRPTSKFTERHVRSGLMKGVTYHYPIVKVEKCETGKEGSKEKGERRPIRRIKIEDKCLEREKSETEPKSKIYFDDQKLKIEVKNMKSEDINMKVSKKSLNENFKTDPENVINDFNEDIHEVRTVKENLVDVKPIDEDVSLKEDIKVEVDVSLSKDLLTTPIDKASER